MCVCFSLSPYGFNGQEGESERVVVCVCVRQGTGWLQKIYHCLIGLRVSYYCYPSPPPSSAQRPRWYISLYMTHAARTHTWMNTHMAGQYISVPLTGSVCVSPIIWPLDSNGWERRVGFPCGLNTRAFITHNRSSILALPFTGETRKEDEKEGRKAEKEKGTGSGVSGV